MYIGFLHCNCANSNECFLIETSKRGKKNCEKYRSNVECPHSAKRGTIILCSFTCRNYDNVMYVLMILNDD